jgi:hypothetical protein
MLDINDIVRLVVIYFLIMILHKKISGEPGLSEKRSSFRIVGNYCCPELIALKTIGFLSKDEIFWNRWKEIFDGASTSEPFIDVIP